MRAQTVDVVVAASFEELALFTFIVSMLARMKYPKVILIYANSFFSLTLFALEKLARRKRVSRSVIFILICKSALSYFLFKFKDTIKCGISSDERLL